MNTQTVIDEYTKGVELIITSVAYQVHMAQIKADQDSRMRAMQNDAQTIKEIEDKLGL